ncbi:MAG: lipid II flippase MurJ, partial [Pseudomonadota bacterium]
TALALAVYGAGLPAFVLQKVLQPLYFAREDTKTPFRYALVAMVINAVVAVGMAWAIGFLGAAIGTSVAAWAMVWLLARGRVRFGEAAKFDTRFVTRVPRIVAATLVMAVVLFAMSLGLGTALAHPAWRYGALATLVFTGIGTYFAAAHILGALRLSDLRAAMRRG